MIRIIGAMLVLWVSVYIGMALSLDGTRRVRENAAFCRLLSAISQGISGIRLPISDILLSYADKTLEACGFLPTVRASIACGEVHDAIGRAVRGLQKEGRLSLDSSEIELLCAYSEEAGAEDAQSEIRRCEYYRQKLAAIGDIAAVEVPKKAKIYRAVSFAMGALCVLGLL